MLLAVATSHAPAVFNEPTRHVFDPDCGRRHHAGAGGGAVSADPTDLQAAPVPSRESAGKSTTQPASPAPQPFVPPPRERPEPLPQQPPEQAAVRKAEALPPTCEGGDVAAKPPAAAEQPSAAAAQPSPPRFEVFNEVMGGGMKGIVQHGTDSWTGQEVAVKRVECDTACPIRFLEVWRGDQLVLCAEGYAPVHSRPVPFEGQLAFDASNEHGARPFEPGSKRGRVLLVRRGGGVSFTQKVANALSGGASGVVVVNHSDEVDIYSVDQSVGSEVCSMMVPRCDGDAAIASCSASSATPATCQVRTDVGHEVQICKRLPPHPNVIQVVDAWEDGNAAVVVMELCRGGKVKGPLELSQALWLTRQMLTGLRHIHENGFVHRDLKPENMLLTLPLEDPESRLVIIDFSMGSSVPHMTVPCGSPKYLAPEVLSGAYGSKRDVWSVGVVAYELIFRRHPFEGVREEDVVQRLRAGPAPVVENLPKAAGGASGSDVPEAVLSLLRGLLDVDPSSRLSAAEALEHPALATTAA